MLSYDELNTYVDIQHGTHNGIRTSIRYPWSDESSVEKSTRKSGNSSKKVNTFIFVDISSKSNSISVFTLKQALNNQLGTTRLGQFDSTAVRRNKSTQYFKVKTVFLCWCLALISFRSLLCHCSAASAE